MGQPLELTLVLLPLEDFEPFLLLKASNICVSKFLVLTVKYINRLTFPTEPEDELLVYENREDVEDDLLDDEGLEGLDG